MKRARLRALSRSVRTLVVSAALLGSATLASVAFGAGPDPAAQTKALLAQLDKPEHKALVSDPVTKAKAAQQRADGARAAGDLKHATELDALALTWAQVADDLVKTAAAEKKLGDAQKQTAELEQKAVRTQALIEQTIARRGRAEQNLNSGATPAGSKAAPAPTKAKPPVKK